MRMLTGIKADNRKGKKIFSPVSGWIIESLTGWEIKKKECEISPAINYLSLQPRSSLLPPLEQEDV